MGSSEKLDKKKEKKEKKKHKEQKHKKKKEDKKDKKKRDKSKKQSKPSSSSTSGDDEQKTSIGPALPPGVTISTGNGEEAPAPFNIGPALPPGVVLPSSSYVDEGSSEDEAGPSASGPEAASGGGEDAEELNQGETAADRTAGDKSKEEEEGASKRRAGPALPAGVDLEKIAAQSAKVDWQQVAVEEEEEEEDLVGPAMPGQVTRGYAAASFAAEQRALSHLIAERQRLLEGDKPRHEEWMTALPDVKELGFTVDQMQQNRTFQRKETTERGDTSAWTDTPEEKERKKREKAMGIKRRVEAGPAVPDTTAAAVSIVQQYNAAVRPKSLVEMHKEEMSSKKRKAEGSGQVAPGTWDRSEITQARQKDAKTVDKMFQDAQTLSGRFGGGSFHGI